jgi:Fe-S cluster biogenesis protein NfuA/nitrite reductase/ring-hydroxylating ferredoxin subunit
MRSRDEIEEAGERIERALQALAEIDDAGVRETALGALRLVVGLYGDALERIVQVVGEGWPDASRALADDDLIASLLMVHDLHPEPVAVRVQRALDEVRPYLGSHGGDVELVGVTDDVVQLKMLGNCDGCPSSSVTLKLAVEGAITTAAPEITDIQVTEESAGHQDGDGPLISPESLLQRPAEYGGPVGNGSTRHPADGPSWRALPTGALPTGATVARALVDGVAVALARTAGGTYAYLDTCAACESSLAGAPVEGTTLTCGHCAARFDVEAAGRGLDGTTGHLAPLPLLQRDGEVELALPAGAAP